MRRDGEPQTAYAAARRTCPRSGSACQCLSLRGRQVRLSPVLLSQLSRADQHRSRSTWGADLVGCATKGMNMQPTTVSEPIRERILKRRGRMRVFSELDHSKM